MFADADAAKIYQMETDSINVLPKALQFAPEVDIRQPVALEYDPLEDRVYWSDVSLKIICRAFRNGSAFEKLITETTTDGLSLDLAGRNLYWTSVTYNTIEMSMLNGSHRRILINTGLVKPMDILVDPIAG